jgi:peptide-methionine (S)-S-oxide reductase
MNDDRSEIATLAGGCFWCTEAIFKRLRGVQSVIPGYSGGNQPPGRQNPTYEDVPTGATGYAETIQITFDPGIIPYDKLLDIFFATHNPTTKNRQGADIGTQYRSVVFYHSPEQKYQVIQKVRELEKLKKFTTSIATEIVPFTKFYKAEDYHRNYYDLNPQKLYCQMVIDPKVRKLIKSYSAYVKPEYATPL